MASIRDLKKDVKYLVEHFISECYTQLTFSIVLDQENTFDVIADALGLRNEIITKLNARPQKEVYKTDKSYYNGIAEDFYRQIIELTERLHSIKD
ncbi:MAG: hypothetical protein EHM93_12685 [Bacteroidales bacterium]|nr:MAG: hypothetical protein EHM93_12685 [Bacteroidales bacterium]